MRSLPRSTFVAAGGLTTLIVMGSALPATAGGGCGRAPTHADGAIVRLFHACMTPTVLRLTEGSAVTFVNDDTYPHNVSSPTFFEDLPRQGASVELRFDEPGVYPYACTLHPGMSGAVVVGDGVGAGRPVVVDAALPEPAESSLVSTRQQASDDRDGGGGSIPTPIAALGAIGLAAASASVGRASVRRRQSQA